MAASILAFCGPHAAPKSVCGSTPTSLLVDAFTCPKNPQKSQIRSAHLKFGGNRTRVLDRLQRGHGQALATSVSPKIPRSCFAVGIETTLNSADESTILVVRLYALAATKEGWVRKPIECNISTESIPSLFSLHILQTKGSVFMSRRMPAKAPVERRADLGGSWICGRVIKDSIRDCRVCS